MPQSNGLVTSMTAPRTKLLIHRRSCFVVIRHVAKKEPQFLDGSRVVDVGVEILLNLIPVQSCQMDHIQRGLFSVKDKWKNHFSTTPMAKLIRVIEWMNYGMSWIFPSFLNIWWKLAGSAGSKSWESIVGGLEAITFAWIYLSSFMSRI